MTVKELIKILEKFPNDSDIYNGGDTIVSTSCKKKQKVPKTINLKVRVLTFETHVVNPNYIGPRTRVVTTHHIID